MLNIVLPSLDTVTDINLVVRLYQGAEDWEGRGEFYSHPDIATALLLPVLLNYLVCLLTFFRTEKSPKFSLFFALLNLYPQYSENKAECHIVANYWFLKVLMLCL